MIAYEIYKMIHIVSIVLLFTTLSLSLVAGYNTKPVKIFSGVATLFLLVSGMGLVARIGISHGESWPLWLQLKVVVWLIIGVGGAVVAKRFQSQGKIFFLAMMALLVFVTYLVNYQPG
jgi:uncharacterized membrane protein SirB2